MRSEHVVLKQMAEAQAAQQADIRRLIERLERALNATDDPETRGTGRS